jgi:hypothetical protein
LFLHTDLHYIHHISNFLQRSGLAAVLEFKASSPELKHNRTTGDEDKNKCSIEFGQPKPLLIANK